MPRRNIPGYLKHKATGQAFCVLKGKFCYLGKYGTKASRDRYEALIADYLANGKELPSTSNRAEITVETLIYRFLKYAKSYYVKNGKTTSTFDQCKCTLSSVERYYGNEPVSKFKPICLVFLRDKWIEDGVGRKTINRRVGTIRQMFRWGVVYEDIDCSISQALEAVDSLKMGRTKAKESEEVVSVDLMLVEKTLLLLPNEIADMVRLQMLVGMRPQDVRNFRYCDVDQTGEVWKYTPFTHKSEHLGKKRAIAIGPKAQEILKPYLDKNVNTPEAFLFLTAKKKPFSEDAYGKAILRACKEGGLETWTPNQLRHTAATKIREIYDLDHAQAVLGHSKAATTEMYAEISFEKAAKVAKEIG